MRLRRIARGKPCHIRLYPGCLGQHESVHLAHVRQLPYNGTGIKPPDWMGAWACSYCARETGEGSSIENRLALYQGMVRTLHALKELGHVQL